MLKKFLVMFLAANLLVSSVAFAQYQPKEELTAEEVELYMSTLDKKVPSVNPAIYGVGAVGVLGFAYAVKKIIKNPELGAYYVAAQDPKAYQKLMDTAAKKAGSAAEKRAIQNAAQKELARMKEYRALAKTHKGMINKISRANYWKFVRSTYARDWAKANKALTQMKRAKSMLKSPATARTWGKRLKRAGWVGLGITLACYVAFHNDREEEIEISNNRIKLERDVRDLMTKDPDALALFIVGLPDEAKPIAYSILAENPKLFKIVKQQVNEAFSSEMLNDYNEYETISEDSLRKEEIFSGDSTSVFFGGWSY